MAPKKPSRPAPNARAAKAPKSPRRKKSAASPPRSSSRRRGAPRLSATRQKALLQLEETLRRRIVGKDDAVDRIARTIRVRMTELDFRPGRPKGSFLLVGPTGVGKNEMAYAVAEALYGTEDGVLSIDLAEIAEEGDLSKLAVSLIPGSDNQLVEGMLTSPVRRDPESVVLLRGLERAHAAFQPILLQILERGRLEDMLGPVDFSRTILFVTTRPRREDIPAGEIGFGRAPAPAADVLHRRLERMLSAELLEGFNEIIALPPLTAGDVRRIARYKVEAVLGRLEQSQRRIEVEPAVYEAFLPETEIAEEGVAILHRTLEDRLFNPLARYLLEHRGKGALRVGMEAGALLIRPVRRAR